MRSEAISSELLRQVTVVIRSVGERTEEVCRALVLEQGVPPEAVFVVRERPFSKTLRVGSEIGLEQGRKWTLFVDADLLLRPSSIEQMLRQAELQPARVCQIQGYCLDKFFGGARIGGVHLYRTYLLNHFIDSIPKEGVDIRPETRALKTMTSKGFPRVIVPNLIGLHGFEQSYKDIFRTSFVQAHKHLDLADFFIPFWREHAEWDVDYRVALAGFAAGIEHPGAVRINEEEHYFRDGMVRVNQSEKTELPASSWNLTTVEKTCSSWEEPASYPDYFPEGMVSSGSGFFGRSKTSLMTQIGHRGFARGCLAWLGLVLVKLSRG